MPGKIEIKVYLLGSLSRIPSFFVWGLVAVFGIVCAILVLKKGWKEGLRASVVLMLVEWLFLILCTAIIFRDIRVERGYNLIPFDSYFHYPENSYFIEAAAVNVLNIFLFVPVGLLLGFMVHDSRFKMNKALLVALIGCGFSILIELLQFFFKRGLCEIDDLIHNVAGCLFGYGMFFAIRYVVKKVKLL